MARTATVMAGIPAINKNLYHRIRFSVMDPVAVVGLPNGDASVETTLLLRDIEMERARRHACVHHVHCPPDFEPEGGLSGDRETATAQAVAEMLRRSGITAAVADRSLPLLFAHVLEQSGVRVECDPEMGVLERRAKDAQEIAHLREAQRVTEEAMRLACEMVARAEAGPDGGLTVGGEPLTSQRVRQAIDRFLLERDYDAPTSIVAGGATSADCHDVGSGRLWSGQSVVIDIFPRNKQTFYNGDCTRTVVHGTVSDELAAMWEAVAAAKRAAIAALKPGVTGEAVHEAATSTLVDRGYEILPAADGPPENAAMIHGTGHGIGLDVHEPPLLDYAGPELVVGDVLTVEPGLYGTSVGGIRLEDMVVVTEGGCENLNSLPEELTWGCT